MKIRDVSSAMYNEAVEPPGLTGLPFTWVLVSKLQPHMYLLGAMRKAFPKDTLARVRHIRLERVTLCARELVSANNSIHVGN